MPSPEALPAGWDRLFDCHLGVAIPDHLGFATGTGPDHKLLGAARGPSGAITG